MNMMELAYKKEFIPGDPAVFGSVDSWVAKQSFRCAWRPATAEKNIRAGRDSAERSIRIWYRPYGMQLAAGDRVAVAGREYDVFYAEPVKRQTATVYADCREVDV